MKDEDKMDCCYRTEPAGGGIQREKGNIKSEQKDRNKIQWKVQTIMTDNQKLRCIQFG